MLSSEPYRSTQDFQSGLSFQPFVKPIRFNSSVDLVFKRSKSFILQEVSGATCSSKKLSMVRIPRRLSYRIEKGSCHSGYFLIVGMIGRVPRPRFQRRPWWAQILRTVFKVISQDSRTRAETPTSFAILFLTLIEAPLYNRSIVPKSMMFTMTQYGGMDSALPYFFLKCNTNGSRDRLYSFLQCLMKS